MKVRDLMTADPVTLHPTDRLVDAEELMGLRGFRHMPVVDGGALVGILSNLDVIRATLEAAGAGDHRARLLAKASIQVREVMSTRCDTVGPEQSAREAARMLRERHRSCLPVVEGDRLVGILTEADFVRWFAEAGPS